MTTTNIIAGMTINEIVFILPSILLLIIILGIILYYWFKGMKVKNKKINDKQTENELKNWAFNNNICLKSKNGYHAWKFIEGRPSPSVPHGYRQCECKNCGEFRYIKKQW